MKKIWVKDNNKNRAIILSFYRLMCRRVQIYWICPRAGRRRLRVTSQHVTFSDIKENDLRGDLEIVGTHEIYGVLYFSCFLGAHLLFIKTKYNIIILKNV